MLQDNLELEKMYYDVAFQLGNKEKHLYENEPDYHLLIFYLDFLKILKIGTNFSKLEDSIFYYHPKIFVQEFFNRRIWTPMDKDYLFITELSKTNAYKYGLKYIAERNRRLYYVYPKMLYATGVINRGHPNFIISSDFWNAFRIAKVLYPSFSGKSLRTSYIHWQSMIDRYNFANYSPKIFSKHILDYHEIVSYVVNGSLNYQTDFPLIGIRKLKDSFNYFKISMCNAYNMRMCMQEGFSNPIAYFSIKLNNLIYKKSNGSLKLKDVKNLFEEYSIAFDPYFFLNLEVLYFFDYDMCFPTKYTQKIDHIASMIGFQELGKNYFIRSEAIKKFPLFSDIQKVIKSFFNYLEFEELLNTIDNCLHSNCEKYEPISKRNHSPKCYRKHQMYGSEDRLVEKNTSISELLLYSDPISIKKEFFSSICSNSYKFHQLNEIPLYYNKEVDFDLEGEVVKIGNLRVTYRQGEVSSYGLNAEDNFGLVENLVVIMKRDIGHCYEKHPVCSNYCIGGLIPGYKIFGLKNSTIY